MSTRDYEQMERSDGAGGRPSERLPIVRFNDGTAEGASDLIVAEEPLEIRLNGQPVAVTMRTPTPGEDAELALGYLLGETIIAAEDVARVSECRSDGGDGGIADVILRSGRQPSPGWQRNFFASSSCGVCGKASIEALRMSAPAVPNGPCIGSETLARMPDALLSSQHVFSRTGGLHAAALFDAAGELAILREDVGRHNAVDKLVGRAAMEDRLPLHDDVLLVSGRVSFEIIQKAMLAGVPIVAAVSAPSTLAVRLAGDSNMTLVGFLRDRGFNVYAGRERIDGLL
jgi:FdhD protein